MLLSVVNHRLPRRSPILDHQRVANGNGLNMIRLPMKRCGPTRKVRRSNRSQLASGGVVDEEVQVFGRKTTP